MAVSVDATGPQPALGAPVALFHPKILNGGTPPNFMAWQYDLAPDGRFLINVNVGGDVAVPITLIQHWHAGGQR
jgi:hypothetical protein